jgi:phosphoribosylformylglycinamidine (FGAM) synthase-like enzyme
LWADRIHGRRGGRLPSLDLAAHRRFLGLVSGLAADGLLAGIHDVSDGGLGAAVAEMAVRSGIGAVVGGVADHVELFSESPTRVVVCVGAEQVGDVRDRATAAGLAVTDLGVAGGDRFVVEGLVDLALAQLVEAWQGALPDALIDL